MSAPVESVRPCGPCAGRAAATAPAKGAFVTEVLIAPATRIRFNQVIVRTETSKVSTDVPTSVAGRVVSVHVQAGDELAEDMLIARVERV